MKCFQFQNLVYSGMAYSRELIVKKKKTLIKKKKKTFSPPSLETLYGTSPLPLTHEHTHMHRAMYTQTHTQ